MQRWVAIVSYARQRLSGGVSGSSAVGGTLAERVASAVGSWRFVRVQALLMVLWAIWNVSAPLWLRWDTWPLILLNLAMSAEAAFTGPILLIAASQQEKRAQAQIDRMEQRQIAELAQLKTLVGELHAHQIGGASVRQRDPKTGRFLPVTGNGVKGKAA